MFRATTTPTADGCVLKLEGWLSGPLVQELDACWRKSMAAHRGARIVVELSDVQFVDAGGRQLLIDMYRGGVEFVAKGCEMSELVREIACATVVGRA